MGKKIKKAFKSVVKVASLGAVGSGGWGSKALSTLSGGLSDTLLGKGKGVPSLKQDSSQDELANALSQQAALAQSRSTDLSLENVAAVETAGSANAQSGSTVKKKKRASGTGLAASLGINVG